MLNLDLTSLKGFVPEDWLERRIAPLDRAAEQLRRGNGPGGAYTGWVTLPRDYDRAELSRIRRAAEKIRADSEVLVVIGIGGSYLGARAVIEALNGADHKLTGTDGPEIWFAGNGLSPDALSEVMERVRDRDFSVNVISKSGTTTEPAVAFRMFRALLEERYGRQGARTRIYATTDARKGALKRLADEQGYETFVVPDAVGGRYSVLTAVGLLPIACAGIDVDRLLAGAGTAMDRLSRPGGDNPAWQYAAARHQLYQGGKKLELLACYEPSLRFFAEWWKQLYGESEGKQGRGLFPVSAEFTADLHSLGQYIQQGERLMFETVVRFARPRRELSIPRDPADGDGLNFLAGKPLSFAAEQAFRGVQLAHVDGGVPNLVLTAEERNEENMGQLLYFFEYACGLSGYLLGVNPFDQPGVEDYKNNMYALLGKPGHETRRAELEARLRDGC